MQDERVGRSRRKMRSGVRWKSREAAAVALEEPISSLYKEMQEWEPVEALLAHTSVILSIDFSKAQIFNRACFGKPIYAATSSQGSASSAPARKKKILSFHEVHASLVVAPPSVKCFMLLSYVWF